MPTNLAATRDPIRAFQRTPEEITAASSVCVTESLVLSPGTDITGSRPLVYTTAIVECRVCGDEDVLGVDVVVKAAEIATFASAHAAHHRFDIHLRLGSPDGYLAGSTQHLQYGRSRN